MSLDMTQRPRHHVIAANREILSARLRDTHLVPYLQVLLLGKIFIQMQIRVCSNSERVKGIRPAWRDSQTCPQSPTFSMATILTSLHLLNKPPLL